MVTTFQVVKISPSDYKGKFCYSKLSNVYCLMFDFEDYLYGCAKKIVSL